MDALERSGGGPLAEGTAAGGEAWAAEGEATEDDDYDNASDAGASYSDGDADDARGEGAYSARAWASEAVARPALHASDDMAALAVALAARLQGFELDELEPRDPDALAADGAPPEVVAVRVAHELARHRERLRLLHAQVGRLVHGDARKRAAVRPRPLAPPSSRQMLEALRARLDASDARAARVAETLGADARERAERAVERGAAQDARLRALDAETIVHNQHRRLSSALRDAALVERRRARAARDSFLRARLQEAHDAEMGAYREEEAELAARHREHVERVRAATRAHADELADERARRDARRVARTRARSERGGVGVLIAEQRADVARGAAVKAARAKREAAATRAAETAEATALRAAGLLRAAAEREATVAAACAGAARGARARSALAADGGEAARLRADLKLVQRADAAAARARVDARDAVAARRLERAAARRARDAAVAAEVERLRAADRAEDAVRRARLEEVRRAERAAALLRGPSAQDEALRALYLRVSSGGLSRAKVEAELSKLERDAPPPPPSARERAQSARARRAADPARVQLARERCLADADRPATARANPFRPARYGLGARVDEVGPWELHDAWDMGAAQWPGDPRGVWGLYDLGPEPNGPTPPPHAPPLEASPRARADAAALGAGGGRPAAAVAPLGLPMAPQAPPAPAAARPTLLARPPQTKQGSSDSDSDSSSLSPPPPARQAMQAMPAARPPPPKKGSSDSDSEESSDNSDSS